MKPLALMLALIGILLAPIGHADEHWQINLKNADINAFISQVADITGKGFVVDPRVKGKVNVISSEPMSKDAVYELFLSVLQVQGFAAVPAGDVTLIIQQNEVKQAGRQVVDKADPTSQEMLTKVIAITNTPALDLVPILRPLVAKYGHLAGVKSANALIISDHAANIRRIEQIIQRLDKTGNEELEVVQLREAWVGNVVTMLQNLDPSRVSQKGGQGKGGKAGELRIVADERSNRLIIKGEKTARARIRTLIEELDQPSYFAGSAQVIRLQYADATKMAEMLENILADVSSSKDGENQAKGKAGIHADEDLNALVIRAEPSLMQEIRELVASLDVRRAQVLIESAIVEVTGDVSDALGVQWFTGDVDAPVAVTNFANAGPSLSTIASSILSNNPAEAIDVGLTLGGVKQSSNGLDFGGIIQAIQSDSSSNLLSTPSIMTLDNQEAEIIVGQNVPFRTGSTTSSNNANPFTTITREDVGITLKVVPHIHDGQAVRLEIEATTESVDQTSNTRSADIITNKRSIKTMVLTENRETIVLGGLIRDDIRESVSRVPVLGRIPLLGALFRSKSVTKVKSNLMVFLKPTIVSDSAGARSLTEDKFNGIWEFSVSSELGNRDLESEIEMLFRGIPLAR